MQMIGAIVSSPDVTAEKVAIAKELIVMRREMEADEAKKLFFKAFVKMQREMKRVQAVREVRNDKGELMYTFASFDDLRTQADPILEANGFGSCFDTKDTGDRLVSIFTLLHEGGHSQSNQFACRYSGPPKTSAAQADTSTKTMAMKGAFCDGVGIVITKGTEGVDARALGANISPEDAADLRNRLHAGERDETAFLAWAKGTTFETIPIAMLGACQNELAKAERVKAGKDAKTKPGAAPCDGEGNLL